MVVPSLSGQYWLAFTFNDGNDNMVLVLVGLHLLAFQQLGDHHDHLHLLLDDHLPEVGKGSWWRSLTGDECLLQSGKLDSACVHVVCLRGLGEER